MNLEEPIATGRVAEIYQYDADKVIKLARPWVPVEWVDYEARIAENIEKTGLRVPAFYGRTSINGREGIIYQYIEGPTMLARIGSEPQKSFKFAQQMAEIHLEIHSIKAEPDLPSLGKRLRGKIKEIEDIPPKIKSKALEGLSALPDGDHLTHGDFHPGNLIHSKDGVVPIDWPDAARGHPLGDVARTWLLIQIGDLPKNLILRFIVRSFRYGFRQAYLTTYFRKSDYTRHDLRPWLLPTLVARFDEKIMGERPALLRLIEKNDRK